MKVLSIVLVGISLLATVVVSKPIDSTADIESEVHVPDGGEVEVTDAGANKCIPDLGSCGKDENCCSKMCRWNMMMGYICIPKTGDWGNAAEVNAVHEVDSKPTDNPVAVREEADSNTCTTDLQSCDEDKDCCSNFCRWGLLSFLNGHVCQPSEVDPEDSSKSCIPPGYSCARDKDCCDNKCIGWPYYSCGG